MTQLEKIIQAMRNLGGKAHYASLYKEYERLDETSLTPSGKAAIRKVIEDHSSDSQNYKGKDDLFYSVEGVGKGVWGLR
jgi:hypothetical protein